MIALNAIGTSGDEGHGRSRVRPEAVAAAEKALDDGIGLQKAWKPQGRNRLGVRFTRPRAARECP